MHVLETWAAFFGAWMLVAGPIYQATLELRDEDIEMERLRTMLSSFKDPPKVSMWWWVLPPVYLYLRHRRTEAFRDEWMASLAEKDYTSLKHYFDKASGWMVVGAGGALLAVSTTWALCAEMDWNVVVFAALVVVMAALAVGYTIEWLRRSRKVDTKRTAVAGASSD